jgi:hypothetical protein
MGTNATMGFVAVDESELAPVVPGASSVKIPTYLKKLVANMPENWAEGYPDRAVKIALEKSIIAGPDKGDPRFKAALDELWLLHQRKCSGYGSDSDPLANLRAVAGIGIRPSTGVWIRMSDKWERLKQLLLHPEAPDHGESVDDNMQDITSYAILFRILRKEEQP